MLDQTCSLNGHFQPSFDSVSEFFGFSEFFYTSEDCLHLAGRWNFDLFRKEAESYCATKWSKLEENWKADKYKADANRLKNQCFKSAWVPVSFIDAKYWCFECNRCISRWFSTMVSTFLLIIKSWLPFKLLVELKYSGLSVLWYSNHAFYLWGKNNNFFRRLIFLF